MFSLLSIVTWQLPKIHLLEIHVKLRRQENGAVASDHLGSASDSLVFASDSLGVAPGKLGRALGKGAFAPEKLCFAAEWLGFAPEKLGSCFRKAWLLPPKKPAPSKWFLAITCTIWLRLIFEGAVHHGISARIFCFFMPGDGFGRPGSDFGTPRSTFWPGDVFGVIWGSRKR